MLQRHTPLARTTGLARTSTLARGGRLSPCSAKMKAQKQAQGRAYSEAADADAEWCFCCGKPGELEHSHIYPQGEYKRHRNDERNWLMMGKWCGCHRIYENNKALFAARWPDVWALIIQRMRAIDLKAYEFYAATNPLLYPD